MFEVDAFVILGFSNTSIERNAGTHCFFGEQQKKHAL